MYLAGDFGTRDFLRATALLEKAVESGDIYCIFKTALLYDDGELVDLDYEKAKILYEKAIALGDVDSMFNLALLYKYGKFGEPNLVKAKDLLELAAASGDADSLTVLAEMYRDGLGCERDSEKARELYEKAASQGHINSIFNLAIGHKNGLFGREDFTQAKLLLERATALGDADSMWSLALMYKQGQCGDPNIAKAKELLESAAALGHSSSMCTLGGFYSEGAFGEPDFQSAKRCFEDAAALDNSNAIFQLAYNYKNGKFGSVDKDSAKKYYERAVSLDHPVAMFNLGLMYRIGEFGSKDFKSANKLFLRAVALGHKKSALFVSNPMIADIVKSISNQGVEKYVVDEIEAVLEGLEEKFFQQRKRHIVEHPAKLAHFTTWQAIESILSLDAENSKTACLRQYHVDYMNDPSEGRRLLEFNALESAKKYPKAAEASVKLSELFDEYYFRSFEKNHPTTQLLPSVFTVSLTKESDRLDLWRAYGKDGHGYCLIMPTQPNNTSGDPVTIRDRRTSREFFSSETRSELDFNDSIGVPSLYWIKYSDEDVAHTLDSLGESLESIFELKNKVSIENWNQIAYCTTAILLEILYLFKDEQYSTEKEARALSVMNIGNSRIKMDERAPGHLYCETAPFLFKLKDSEIVLGPKVPTPAASIWNIRYRLSRLGIADKVTVRKSKVPYR
nr:SEL1-like repeat protein [Duganella alba]